MRYVTLLLAILLLPAALSTASAEIIVLTGGGRVVGQWLNRDETPRKQYVIQVDDGSKVTIDADQVAQVLRPRADEAEYERIRPTYADTAAAQWELAQWCRNHNLKAQREPHLRRVVELDPNHADARRALGYSQVEGKWVTRDEAMIQRGYQRYKGQWNLPQEIEILKSKEELTAGQQEWFQKLKRWRGWLGGDRHDQACANIRSINDPVAGKALTLALRDESVPTSRLLYIEALAKIDNPDAAKALAITSIYDAVEEIRLTCLDRLETKKRPEITSYYVGKLKDKDNRIVNLAALALGRMKDPSSIGPLIDALVTTHKFKIVKAGGDNATSASFGSGGTGMSAGGGPKFIRQNIPNQTALDALVAVTGQNFNFDKQAWKYWFAAQKKAPDTLDARRD